MGTGRVQGRCFHHPEHQEHRIKNNNGRPDYWIRYILIYGAGRTNALLQRVYYWLHLEGEARCKLDGSVGEPVDRKARHGGGQEEQRIGGDDGQAAGGGDGGELSERGASDEPDTAGWGKIHEALDRVELETDLNGGGRRGADLKWGDLKWVPGREEAWAGRLGKGGRG